VKLLLDSCLSRATAAELRAMGMDVVWTGDWPRDPGDPAILIHSKAEGRVLVTLDNDFGELVFAKHFPHCGIIRLVDVPAREHAIACMKVLEAFRRDLPEGAIVTVETGRTRVRLPDDDDYADDPA
jgi:predicted nuclease of predicted toxin-antitoxin system